MTPFDPTNAQHRDWIRRALTEARAVSMAPLHAARAMLALYDIRIDSPRDFEQAVAEIGRERG